MFMAKKNKTIEKVETKGKKSPAIYTENGNVSINYGSSGNIEQPNSQQQSPKNSKLRRNLILIGLIISILGGIAEFSGYSIKDLFYDNNVIPNIEAPSNERVETSGDNSPAVIVKDGNATINYDKSNQDKDSTSQK